MSLFSASSQTFTPIKCDCLLHCLTAACQLLPVGNAVLSNAVLSNAVFAPLSLRWKTSSAWALRWRCFWRCEGSAPAPAASRTTSCPPPSAAGSSTSSTPRTPWSVTSARGYDRETHLWLRTAAAAAAVVSCSLILPAHTRFFSAQLRLFQWEMCKCWIIYAPLLCSGLQTGASHPQALQQYRAHSNPLVMSHFHSFSHLLSSHLVGTRHAVLNSCWCCFFLLCRCSATNPTSYDEIRPTLLNPVKEPTSDTESIPSPSTSPVLPRRHYGESITSLGKASILGKARPARSSMICSSLSSRVSRLQINFYWTLLFVIFFILLLFFSWINRNLLGNQGLSAWEVWERLTLASELCR